MTLTEMLARLRANIEDVASTYYLDAELVRHLNQAKDEVVSLVRIFTDEFPTAETTLTYAANDTSENLPTGILDIIRLYDSVNKVTYDILPYQNMPAHDSQSLYCMYRVRAASGAETLVRSPERATDPLTLLVTYVPGVTDFATGSPSTEFTFGPPPADTLIILKATVYALIARKRRESAAMFMQREEKVDAQLNDNLKMRNKHGPRYVHYVPD